MVFMDLIIKFEPILEITTNIRVQTIMNKP